MTLKPLALVTGASSGLGTAFAAQLAARGFDLVLTARSKDALNKIATELTRKQGVVVQVLPADLGKPGAAAKVMDALVKKGSVPDVLINNAGFGLNEAFVDHDPRRLAEMIQLNVVTLTELTFLIGRHMTRGRGGHILLVASMAAYQPAPLFAVYAATKAYILSLGEALNIEMAPNIKTTVLSPGLMETKFAEASGYQMPSALKRAIVSPDRVANIGLNAMFAGKPSVIAGTINRLLKGISFFFSRNFSAKQNYRLSGGK